MEALGVSKRTPGDGCPYDQIARKILSQQRIADTAVPVGENSTGIIIMYITVLGLHNIAGAVIGRPLSPKMHSGRAGWETRPLRMGIKLGSSRGSRATVAISSGMGSDGSAADGG